MSKSGPLDGGRWRRADDPPDRRPVECDRETGITEPVVGGVDGDVGDDGDLAAHPPRSVKDATTEIARTSCGLRRRSAAPII